MATVSKPSTTADEYMEIKHRLTKLENVAFRLASDLDLRISKFHDSTSSEIRTLVAAIQALCDAIRDVQTLQRLEALERRVGLLEGGA